MNTIEDENITPEKYEWDWVNPKPIDNMQAIALNENIAGVLTGKSMFVDFQFKGFEDTIPFVTTLYEADTLVAEDIDILSRNLLSLRSIDLQIKHIKAILKKDGMINWAELVLIKIIPVIRENPVVLEKLNKILKKEE